MDSFVGEGSALLDGLVGSDGFITSEQLAHPTDENTLAMATLVRAGLPVESVDALVERGVISSAELDAIILPRRTLAHRRAIGRLTPEQSDRVVRLSRIVVLAQETFGSADKAATWLRRKTKVLAGEAPLTMLDTEPGAHQVEVLLGRITHGIAA